MKKITFLIFGSLIGMITYAQEKPNVYMVFSDFKANTPSLYFDFQLKQRTEGNVFMTGGITNYMIKKIKPTTETDNLTKNVWGVLVNDSIYINRLLIHNRQVSLQCHCRSLANCLLLVALTYKTACPYVLIAFY